jgi:hypothetical protein
MAGRRLRACLRALRPRARGSAASQFAYTGYRVLRDVADSGAGDVLSG